MFAVQCSFCNHENTPGTRFCAECGSPLHLRVCPNQHCGKVSDVNARRCEHCGTTFPEIALAEHGTQPEEPAPAPVEHYAPSPAKTSPWPLIVVALVAGGLPLLWINRAYLPKPKGWQAPPETPHLVAPPPLATQPIIAPAARPPTAPPPVAEPPPPPPPQAVEPSLPTPLSGTDAATARTESSAQKARLANSNGNKPRKPKKPDNKDTAPAKPCTEAVAALGLCDPKSIKK